MKLTGKFTGRPLCHTHQIGAGFTDMHMKDVAKVLSYTLLRRAKWIK